MDMRMGGQNGRKTRTAGRWGRGTATSSGRTFGRGAPPSEAWATVLEDKEDPRYTAEEAMIVAVEALDARQKLLGDERKAERVLTLRRPEALVSLNGRRGHMA